MLRNVTPNDESRAIKRRTEWAPAKAVGAAANAVEFVPL